MTLVQFQVKLAGSSSLQPLTVFLQHKKTIIHVAETVVIIASRGNNSANITVKREHSVITILSNCTHIRTYFWFK